MAKDYDHTEIVEYLDEIDAEIDEYDAETDADL